MAFTTAVNDCDIANMILMAAAPEMLEMLKKWASGNYDSSWTAETKALIAKAEGGKE